MSQLAEHYLAHSPRSALSPWSSLLPHHHTSSHIITPHSLALALLSLLGHLPHHHHHNPLAGTSTSTHSARSPCLGHHCASSHPTRCITRSLTRSLAIMSRSLADLKLAKAQ